ncbi:MAG: hypothetical protein WA917_01670 [Comamonas sp.]|nr:hypothetical protein [Comamonas sp.]
MPTASVSNDAQRLSALVSPHGISGASRDPQGDTPPQQAVQESQDGTRVTLSTRAQELAARSDQTAGQDRVELANSGEADSRNARLLRAYDGHA